MTVVIVNYNGLHLLADCLNSLRAGMSEISEVIVVDNASSDGSHQWLSHRTDVRIVEMDENVGFGRACNCGVAESTTPYVLLLNSDARFNGSLEPALRHLHDHPQTAVVGGRLLYGDGRLQHSIGLDHTPQRIVLSWLGLGRFTSAPAVFRRFVVDPHAYDGLQIGVSWVSGALMLVDRAAWMAVGGMYPGYFMYMEDVDFCRTLREAGRRIDYVPSLAAVHLEGGGKPWIGRRALLDTTASYLMYVYRHHSPWGPLALRAGLAPVYAARALAELALGLADPVSNRRERAAAFLAASGRLLKP